MASKHELTKTGRYLHWIIAVFILALLIVGFYMVNTETWSLYDWHKSFGLIATLLIAVRMIYRLKRGWLKPVRQYPRHELMTSHIVHWLLLVGILAIPLTGMLYSGASGHGFGVFGWTLMPENHDDTGVVPHDESIALWGQQAHSLLGYGLAFVIALHLLGALKHHFLDRDDTLRRMLGRSDSTRRENSQQPIRSIKQGKAQ